HIEQCLEISRCLQWTQEYMRAFVEDHSVMGLAFQASLLWLLGYPEQGVAVGRKSLAMARELDRPSTLAFALYSELLRVGLFEADPDKAKPLVDELASYCKQTGVQIYGVWGSFYHGVAATKNPDPRPGIGIMHGVRDALKQNNVRLFAPLHSYHL